METIACDLCGSTRHTALYETPDRLYPSKELFTVVECNECGLGFVNPRPRFNDMARYYPQQYYQYGFSENRQDLLEKRYGRQASYLRELEQRGTSRHLLDVGCANGGFPRYMTARGWTVEGVEVSASTPPIHEFPVYSQPFPQIPVDTPSYDAVTAWAVLEHVHHPMACFQKASQVLKPGGLFVFLVTNFSSFSSRRLFCEDVPRHLFFFTRETVNRYLQSSGFCLEREDNRGNIFRMGPENWLRFFLREQLAGEKFSWNDTPPSREAFIQRNRLRPGLISSLRYALKYPLRAVERPFWPILEGFQILRRTYGISTFVARKG